MEKERVLVIEMRPSSKSAHGFLKVDHSGSVFAQMWSLARIE